MQEERKISKMNSPLKILLFSSYQALRNKNYEHSNAAFYSSFVWSFCAALVIPSVIGSFLKLMNMTDVIDDTIESVTTFMLILYFCSFAFFYLIYFSSEKFKKNYDSVANSSLVNTYPVFTSVLSISVLMFFSFVSLMFAAF